MSVKAGNDDDVDLVSTVEKRVGKPGDAEAPDLSMQNPASGWEPLQASYGEIDFCNECVAQAWSLAFVPLARVGEVLRRPVGIANGQHSNAARSPAGVAA